MSRALQRRRSLARCHRAQAERRQRICVRVPVEVGDRTVTIVASLPLWHARQIARELRSGSSLAADALRAMAAGLVARQGLA